MYKDLLAGCAAGSSGVLIGHPLDTLKTRVQLQKDPSVGAMRILRGVLRREGFVALYLGMSAPLTAAGLLNALLFSGYTLTLGRIRHCDGTTMEGGTSAGRNARQFETSEIIFASTIGTLLQLIPAIPIELVKTKLQIQSCSNVQIQSTDFELTRRRPQFTGPLNCAANIVRKDGLRGLYRGGSLMFWRDLIGYFFYIPAYEHFRKALIDCKESSSNFVPLNEGICELLAGGLAGSLSWWIICPLELLKNRLQASIQSEGQRQANWRQICRQVFQQGSARGGGSFFAGICAFYRGGSLLAMRAFPVNACIFFVHSKCMQML